MESTNPGGRMSGALSDPKEAGTALLKQGRFDEAAAVLREAVALDNNDEIAWRLLGGALASKGDAQGAITAFQNSVRIVPRAARSHYNLGLAFQSAGRLTEAKASLEQALALDPGHEPARARLGEISQQLGQRVTPSAAAPVASEGHTNIGGGNSTGLASISSPMMQAQAQAQSQGDASSGHTNIGGANSTGLLSIGANREVPSSGGGGHTNIGGASTVGLSTVGMSGPASAPQESGHTNIGGGNTGMLGTVGPSGNAPTLRAGAPPSSAPPMSMPPSSAPSSYQPSSGGYVPPPVLGQNYSQDLMNNSGMQGEVPDDVAKPFNWGAFFFSWIWLINMKMPQYGWGLFIGSLILSSITRGLNIPALNGILSIAQLGLDVYLGINGNRLAWKNRVFESKEDFHACQRTWAYWSIGWIGICIVLGILFAVMFGALLAAGMSGSTGRLRH